MEDLYRRCLGARKDSPVRATRTLWAPRTQHRHSAVLPKAVGMELGHGREVLGQHFTVASLQRLHGVIGSFFSSVLDFF